MDRASFHTSKKIRVLIQFFGCILIFLLSYLPNLNPIEKF
ncbi:transposase [Holospora curviuscula]